MLMRTCTAPFDQHTAASEHPALSVVCTSGRQIRYALLLAVFQKCLKKIDLYCWASLQPVMGRASDKGLLQSVQVFIIDFS